MKSQPTYYRNRKLFRMTGILMFGFLLLSTLPLKAQCWQWAINAGGDTYELSTGIAVDPFGNIAVTGEFSGTAVIGDETLVAVAGRDVFTAILDSSGVIRNAMSGVGDGTTNISNGIGMDGDGNVYITGNFKGTIAFGDTSLVSEGNQDIFIVKYDPSGTLLWAVRAGGASNINSNDIAVDQDGNCYIVGDFYNTATFGDQIVYSFMAEDVFTAKYDPDGNALWAESSGSIGTDNGLGIALDPSGNVYIAGLFQSEYSFKDSAFTSLGNRDGFVAKYDNTGDPLWAMTGGGWNNEVFNKLAVDGNGEHLYITGEFESDTISINGMTLVNKNPSGLRRDILLLSINTDGSVLWVRSAGSQGHDYSWDVSVDDHGEIYITGSFDDTLVFDQTNQLIGEGDPYIAKYDISGSLVYATAPTVNTASGTSVSISSFKNRPLITGGLSAGSSDPVLVFDYDTLVSNGSTDFYVAKIGPPCSQDTPGTGLKDIPQMEVTVFPNPFYDRISIRPASDSRGFMEIKIYNAQGSLIHSERFNQPENIEVPTDHLPAGIYFMNLTNGGTTKSIKMVRAR